LVSPHLLKQKLIAVLSSPLPGNQAHLKMAVPGRSLYPDIPDDAKKAAVLILLYERIDRVFVALIKRKFQDSDRHSGQISFPGGKMEASDHYPIQTALREATEEIGITDDIEILGTLSTLYIPVSNFHVAPVIAWHTAPNPRFKIETSEVAELIEMDLQLILDDSLKNKVDIIIQSSMILHDVPAYDVHGQVIWGATAMILSELEWVIKLN
jgi:8-oxo-dGTP pyrophosphatase MutT (NUDIX family)